MFRDLKEYQKIAKIYTEKVSKSENLEERRGSSVQQLQKNRDVAIPNKKPVPQVSGNRGNRPEMKGGIDIKIQKPTVQGAQGRTKRPTPKPSNTDASGKVIPTTAEIRAKAGKDAMSNIPKKEGNAVIDGKKINPNFGKKVEIKNEPKISKFTKQGKERTKAQMMAAKRIGSGTAKNPDTTIAQVKKSNTDAMKARAEKRFAAFKAKRLARMNKEEFTPYDIVLEYLLSSEQAATIEEANYVMTEMDAETIQGIVEEQKKTLIEKPDDGYIGPKFLGIKTIGKRREEFQLDSNLKKLSKTGDSPETRDMLNIPRDYKITPEQKAKYGFK